MKIIFAPRGPFLLAKLRAMQPRIAIGVVLFGTRYLAESLPSLLAAAPADSLIFLLDQEEPAFSASKFIQKELPELLADPRVQLLAGPNLFHSGGHNQLIRRAIELGCEYYLVASNDMLYEPGSIQQLAAALDDPANQDCAVAGPKLLVWQKDSKDRIIDSAGLVLESNLGCSERGRGQADGPEFGESRRVFGCTAALALLRISALREAALPGESGPEFFCELLHYKNDYELALRLQLAGFGAVFVPGAAAWHDRQFGYRASSFIQKIRARRAVSLFARQDSLFGQLVIARLYSHFFARATRLRVAADFIRRIFFAAIFEPGTLRALGRLFRSRRRLRQLAAALQIHQSGASQLREFVQK